MAKSDYRTSDSNKKKKKKSDKQQKSYDKTKSNDMSNSDDSEEHDDDIYNVEAIVGHEINEDTGEIKYLIKWEGYSDQWANSLEPEGNLEGCVELLREYQRRNNIPVKKNPDRRVTFEIAGSSAASTARQQLTKSSIFLSDDEDDDEDDSAPIALVLEKKKGKKKATENTQPENKGKQKEKSGNNYTIPKYSQVQGQQNSQNEPQRRQPTQSQSLLPSPTKDNIPQKPSLFIHKDHTPSSSTSSSFTNLKRSTASKAAQPVEIDLILSKFNNGTFRQNHPAAPKPLQITRPTPMPVSAYHSSSSASTTPPTTPTTSQTAIRTNPIMPDLSPQRQPPASPVIVAPQPHQRPAVPLPPHQPFHQQLSASIPIKRQTSRPDPRLIANERKKFKFSNNESSQLEVLLKKGNDPVCQVTLNGATDKVPQFDRIKHLLELQNPQGNEMTINTFLPIKRFSDYLPAEKTLSFMSIVFVDQFIQAAKLRNFMSVNEITGIVCHPDMPTEALFIMAAKDVSKVSDLPADTGFQNARLDQLVAIFVDNLPPRPRLNLQDIDYSDDSDQLFSWRRMCRYLKFPAQLQQLYQTTNFYVCGHSESSAMLTKACGSLPQVTRRSINPLIPHNIMMFDRFDNELQHKNLLKHKREPVTQIWEFGVPNFYYGDIEPACEVFPQHSGGFITTDAINMVKNPHIIEDICSQIKRFNDVPVAFGEWKFVLPHNFLQDFKQLLKDGHNSVAVQEALIYVTIALSNGDIEIMRTWPEEKQEPNSIVFMKHILREYYKKYQYFVYVDDINAVDVQSKETHVSIDFVTTDTIYRTFA